MLDELDANQRKAPFPYKEYKEYTLQQFMAFSAAGEQIETAQIWKLGPGQLQLDVNRSHGIGLRLRSVP